MTHKNLVTKLGTILRRIADQLYALSPDVERQLGPATADDLEDLASQAWQLASKVTKTTTHKITIN